MQNCYLSFEFVTIPHIKCNLCIGLFARHYAPMIYFMIFYPPSLMLGLIQKIFSSSFSESNEVMLLSSVFVMFHNEYKLLIVNMTLI